MALTAEAPAPEVEEPQPTIRCGHCPRRHFTAREVYNCWAYERYAEDDSEAMMKIERSYELWLETRFSDVIRWEEEQERLRIGF